MVCSHNECTYQAQQNRNIKVLPRGMLQNSIINLAQGNSTRKIFIMDRINS